MWTIVQLGPEWVHLWDGEIFDFGGMYLTLDAAVQRLRMWYLGY